MENSLSAKIRCKWIIGHTSWINLHWDFLYQANLLLPIAIWFSAWFSNLFTLALSGYRWMSQQSKSLQYYETNCLVHTLHTAFLSDNISSLRKLVKFDTQEQIINKASRARDLAKLECSLLFTCFNSRIKFDSESSSLGYLTVCFLDFFLLF